MTYVPIKGYDSISTIKTLTQLALFAGDMMVSLNDGDLTWVNIDDVMRHSATLTEVGICILWCGVNIVILAATSLTGNKNCCQNNALYFNQNFVEKLCFFKSYNYSTLHVYVANFSQKTLRKMNGMIVL